MRVDRLQCHNGKELDGPLLITPQVFGDERGFFFESWNERRFRAALIDAGTPVEEADALRFRQDNHSSSCQGVLRGLHYQLPPEPQGKLVRCSVGAIFDVAVDLRAHSQTYGMWVAADTPFQSCYSKGGVHGGGSAEPLKCSRARPARKKRKPGMRRVCGEGLRSTAPKP